jgi:hypothetical protein
MKKQHSKRRFEHFCVKKYIWDSKPLKLMYNGFLIHPVTGLPEVHFNRRCQDVRTFGEAPEVPEDVGCDSKLFLRSK